MHVPHIHFCLNKEWQKALDNGVSNDTIPPWYVHIPGNQPETNHLVQNLSISGTCLGDEIHLPNGLPIKVIACKESSLVWTGTNLHIENFPKVARARNSGKRILVRLFTPWLEKRDDSVVLPWRILEEVSPDTFEEKQALSFQIVGESFGLRYDFPQPTGPKMHIACYGNVEWDGAHAHISS